MLSHIINKIKEELIKESTSVSGGRGSFISPLQLGTKEFDKTALQPFNTPVSKYNDSMLAYDSYDGEMSLPKKQIKKIEHKAKKQSDYLKKHPNLTSSDDDGNNINQTPGYKKKIVPVNEWVEILPLSLNESSTSITSGLYNGPTELGLKKWKKSELGPYYEFVDTKFNHNKKQKTLKNNVNRVVGVWEKNKDESYDMDTHDVDTVKENLSHTSFLRNLIKSVLRESL
jgi:hypothetical protein